MGLTVSDCARIGLTRVAMEKALPFEPLIPDETTLRAIRAARAGRVTKSANLGTLFRAVDVAT